MRSSAPSFHVEIISSIERWYGYDLRFAEINRFLRFAKKKTNSRVNWIMCSEDRRIAGDDAGKEPRRFVFAYGAILRR